MCSYMMHPFSTRKYIISYLFSGIRRHQNIRQKSEWKTLHAQRPLKWS